MNLNKKIFLLFIFIISTGLLNSQTIDSLYQVATWQGFRKGAVSFTFDDNCANQLSVVKPMFDQYGFKMTFFTVISWGPNWTALQTAASNGHEIASHTVSHSSLGTLSDSLQTMELKNSQDAINSHITGQKCLTIAYPNCVVGNSSICKQYYIAARGCSGQIVPKTPPDFMNISSIVCGNQGSIQRTSDFTDKITSAGSSNGWIVFLIHAIDQESGYSPTSSAQLKGALDFLNQNKDKYWESTFLNVAKYIKERNNASIKQVSLSDSIITCTVTDTLENTVYNYPLTIRRVLPQGWTEVQVSQNGRILNSQIDTVNNVKYIMFDAAPDSGDIYLIRANVTGVLVNSKSQILTPVLLQNFPNPFNPETIISYQLPMNNFVTLKVYDVLGKEVTTLVNEWNNAGSYQVTFNGSKLASGIYSYKLQAGDFTSIKKMILLK
jgi:hypothetical protein